MDILTTEDSKSVHPKLILVDSTHKQGLNDLNSLEGYCVCINTNSWKSAFTSNQRVVLGEANLEIYVEHTRFM